MEATNRLLILENFKSDYHPNQPILAADSQSNTQMKRPIRLLVALRLLSPTFSFLTLSRTSTNIRSVSIDNINPNDCKPSYLASSQGSDDEASSIATISSSPRRTWVQRKPDENQFSNKNADEALFQSTRMTPWDIASTSLIQQTTQLRELSTNSASRLRNLRKPRQQQSLDQTRRLPQFLSGNFFNSSDDSDASLTQETRTFRTQQKQGRRQPRPSKMSPMPVRGYDAAAIEDYYDLRPFEVGWRLNSLGLPLLGKLQI